MSITITLDHVCPNCRAPRPGYSIPGAAAGGPLKPGDLLPAGLEAVRAEDTCPYCGQGMTAYLALDDERPQGGEGVRLLTAVSLEKRASRIARSSQRRRILRQLAEANET